MAELEKNLFDAAVAGNISVLLSLLNEDPLILHRVETTLLSDTPLHVAAMLGHTDFVKEIIRVNPQLTTELNSLQSSPLHLASAKGHADVVRALLSVNPQVGLARDRNNLTPLHLAALKGRTEVIKVFLGTKPNVAELMVHQGQNILHMCIQHFQLKSLKLLLNDTSGCQLLSATDTDGNTLLHLAVAYKQVETIEFLLAMPGLDVNAQNRNGMTAMDVLIQSRGDIRDEEIQESLKKARGFEALEGNKRLRVNDSVESEAPSSFHDQKFASPSRQKSNGKQSFNGNWLDEKRNAWMVVASVIATVAFQVGVNPPGGVWQDDKGPHEAGFSILADKNRRGYKTFCIVNTVSFISSLTIILLLMSGLPIRCRPFMWILMVITWISITTTGYAYIGIMTMLTPPSALTSVLPVLEHTIEGWVLLMVLLLIGHTIRLIIKAVRKIIKAVRKIIKAVRKLSKRLRRRRGATTTSSAIAGA